MSTRSDEGLSPSRNQHHSRRNPAVQRGGVGRAEHDGNADLLGHSDIVNTAMRLYQGVPVELNECVEIALEPSISIHGNVVWVNGRNCGIAFEKRGSVTVWAGTLADTQAKGLQAPLQVARPFCGTRSVGNSAAAPYLAPRDAQDRHDGVFVPGLRVKVLLGGNRERCAVVRWSWDNIAELLMS